MAEFQGRSNALYVRHAAFSPPPPQPLFPRAVIIRVLAGAGIYVWSGQGRRATGTAARSRLTTQR